MNEDFAATINIFADEFSKPKDKTTKTQDKISEVLDSMKRLLTAKNKKYGNSALEPLGVFSKQDASNSICIRIDDKLSRIRNSQELRKNDVSDLIGYLTLLCVDKGWTRFDELID